MFLLVFFVMEFLVEPSEKSVEIMRKFSEQYARRSDTFFCVDKSVTSVVIKVAFFFFPSLNPVFEIYAMGLLFFEIVNMGYLFCSE